MDWRFRMPQFRVYVSTAAATASTNLPITAATATRTERMADAGCQTPSPLRSVQQSAGAAGEKETVGIRIRSVLD